MKFLSTLALAATITLSACGGGGGSTAAAPTPTPALAKYAGSWQFCTPSGERQLSTIVLLADGSLDFKEIREYFESNTCTGTVVATRSSSAVTTLTRTSGQDVSVALPPSTVPTLINIDNVSVSSTTGRITYSGTAVAIDPTTQQWCVNRVGRSSCESDLGLRPAETATANIYTDGAKLYSFTGSGASLKANSAVYTKN